MKTRTRILGTRIAAGATILLTLTGIYAFRAVFARPGEATLQLMPADALAVASLDLNPSPGQALTFKRIDDALARNGVKEPFQRSILDLVEHAPEAKPLRELTTRSASVCLLKSSEGKQDMQMVLFMPLTDGAAAKDVLAHHGYQRYWKGTSYYVLPHSQSGMMVEGETLVISTAPWTLHEVAEVEAGSVAPITKSKEFTDARALEPDDANLLLFVSPRLMAELSKQTGAKTGGWFVAGVTVQDGGVALDGHGKFDDPDKAPFKQIASMAPLRPDLEQVLPAGAYATIAYSQLGKVAQAIESSFEQGGHSKDLDSFKKKLSDSMGIDADADVVPAFMGDAVIAAYPTVEPEGGIDLLAVVDNQNNADPASLADKFKAFVDRQAEKDSDMGRDWSQPMAATGGEAFRLSDKVQDELRKSITGHPNAHDPLKYDVLGGNKTVAWAKVNGAVLIATSKELLNQAIDAYQGKGPSLRSDDLLKAADDTSDGSQAIGAVSFSRIATGLQNTLDESKMDDDARKVFDMALTAFRGLKQPLAIRGKVSPDGNTSGSLFVPVDYDGLIDFIGSLAHKRN